MCKIKILQLDYPWIEGEIDGMRFSAKVYRKPSPFGIKQGRVSKLNVEQKGISIVNYDRGLDIVSKEAQTIIDVLVSFLEEHF